MREFPNRGIQREVAGRQSSPSTGKLFAPPAGKPGYFLVEENLRRSLLRHFVPSVFKESYRAPSMAFFKAWRNLSGPMWFPNQNQNQNQTKPWGEADTASRRSAPSPGKRTRREDHAPLIVRDEFRPAIPRSGCSPALPVSALPAHAE